MPASSCSRQPNKLFTWLPYIKLKCLKWFTYLSLTIWVLREYKLLVFKFLISEFSAGNANFQFEDFFLFQKFEINSRCKIKNNMHFSIIYSLCLGTCSKKNYGLIISWSSNIHTYPKLMTVICVLLPFNVHTLRTPLLIVIIFTSIKYWFSHRRVHLSYTHTQTIHYKM